MTRKHGVTDEDERQDEEKDERNYGRAKEGGCCLLEALAVVGLSSFSLVLVLTL